MLMSPKNAAALLGVSETTLATWRWKGRGPVFIKLGSKVAYRRADIEDWIGGQVRASTSDHGAERP